MEINKTYNENCLDTMQRMKDNFIDMVLTSPPYDDILDYKGYEFDFNNIAQELFRVVKKGGVVVWIVGDKTIDGSESGSSFRQALYFMECGFNLHDTMIYEKTPSYPASDKSNRYSQSFEYMFILSKGKPKTANLLKDRRNRWAKQNSFGKQSERLKNGELKKRKVIKVNEFGYRFNIWNYATGKRYSTTDEIAYRHPAIFPENLASDHIRTWSNKEDLIYDPFGGSGTTGKVAHILDRNWIMSEISSEYCEIIEERLKPYFSQLLAF